MYFIKQQSHVALLLILSAAFQLSIANDRIDSLKTVIEREHDINKKATLLLELSLEYLANDIDQSEKFARQAIMLIDKAENERIAGLLFAHLGDIAFLQDSLKKAEKEFDLAIPLLERTGEFKRLIRVYISLGNRFVEKGNYPEAMDHYLRGLGKAEEINDSTYLPNLYNNLGVVYINLNDHKTALDYYTRALTLFEEIKDTMNIAGATTNIGSIYIHFGEYEIARQYYLNGYEIFSEIGYLPGQAHVLFKVGLLDKLQQYYENALKNLFESKKIQLADETNTPLSKSMFLAETDINIGIVYLKLQDYNKAKDYLQSGLAAAMKGDQAGLISLAGEQLSDLYRQIGKYEKALENYVLFKTYSDSIYNEENIRKLTQLEMQYQFDARMREAELNRVTQEQKRKRLILIYIATTVGLVLLLIIVMLMLKLERKKKSEIELERERLAEKLDHTNKELTTYVMYLLKKNEFILTIIEKLKRARLEAKVENKKIMTELISELKSNTDVVTWEEFEVRFQQVHTDFYSKLSRQFPDLTPNEIRLCAFFKLNMTSKEIAALTYQSLNSIKVARYRLRKKLMLEKNDSLVAFLTKF